MARICETPLQIYFVSGFIPTDSASIDTASGLRYTSFDGIEVIILTASVPEDLPHELMHAMDDSILRYQVELSEDAPYYLGYWEELTPEGFDYFWTYHYEEGPEAGEYTNMWSAPEDVWFVDSYAKTFPTEDRARVFEYLFLRDSDPFTDAPHLTEKAGYLCALLRAVFGYESASWERGIDVPKLSEFDAAVREYTDSIVPVG